MKTQTKAILASIVVLALALCAVSGVTQAWFTDSESSGPITLTAGNLDVEVTYTKDGIKWNDIDRADDLFGKSWEPGHTEVVVLKVENKGSLALKYKVNMNIMDEVVGKTTNGSEIQLSEILQVSTLTIEEAGIDPVFGQNIAATTLEKAFEGEDGIGWNDSVPFKSSNILQFDKELRVGITQYVFVKVDMPETVGNEVNHNGVDIPSIKFYVDVLATQYPSESDSFGKDYDADIWKYIQNEALSYVKVGPGESVFIEGGSIQNEGDVGFLNNEGKATLKNLTIEGGSSVDYANILSGEGSVTEFTGVEIVSKGGGVGVANGAKATFNSGSVYVDTDSTSGRYLFYLEGADSELTINGGTFSWDPKDNQKRAYVYAGAGTTVYIDGGIFGKASTRSGYTAGLLGAGDIIITGGTFGFDPSNWVKEGYEAVKSDETWTVSQS